MKRFVTYFAQPRTRTEDRVERVLTLLTKMGYERLAIRPGDKLRDDRHVFVHVQGESYRDAFDKIKRLFELKKVDVVGIREDGLQVNGVTPEGLQVTKPTKEEEPAPDLDIPDVQAFKRRPAAAPVAIVRAPESKVKTMMWLQVIADVLVAEPDKRISFLMNSDADQEKFKSMLKLDWDRVDLSKNDFPENPSVVVTDDEDTLTKCLIEAHPVQVNGVLRSSPHVEAGLASSYDVKTLGDTKCATKKDRVAYFSSLVKPRETPKVGATMDPRSVKISDINKLLRKSRR